MQARMKNPAMVLPEAMKALLALAASIKKAGLPQRTLELVHLRASQINGCSVCLDMHGRELKRQGESDVRLLTVSAWRDAPYFNDAERAALALTEAVTRLSDRPDAVSDEVWETASKHFTESELAQLILSIGLINLWNRLNVPTRQIAGDWTKSAEVKDWAESVGTEK